jgi:hypothetical protein
VIPSPISAIVNIPPMLSAVKLTEELAKVTKLPIASRRSSGVSAFEPEHSWTLLGREPAQKQHNFKEPERQSGSSHTPANC